MENKKNYITVIVALIAAINAMLLDFGTYHLSNSSLQVVDQVVSWIVTYGGVVISHHKPLKSYFVKG